MKWSLSSSLCLMFVFFSCGFFGVLLIVLSRIVLWVEIVVRLLFVSVLLVLRNWLVLSEKWVLLNVMLLFVVMVLSIFFVLVMILGLMLLLGMMVSFMICDMRFFVYCMGVDWFLFDWE